MVKRDYHKRPGIEKVYNLIYNEEKIKTLIFNDILNNLKEEDKQNSSDAKDNKLKSLFNNKESVLLKKKIY